MLTGSSSRALTPQQILIDRLCNLAGDPDTTVGLLKAFLAEEKISNDLLNEPDTTTKLRPIEHTAVSGNLAVFQYLVEVKNVSLDAKDNFNLMELSSEAHSSPEIRNYIYANKLWQWFADGTTELHADIWGGNPDDAAVALETALDEDTDGEDHDNIMRYLGIRCRLAPQDPLNITYETMTGKKTFSAEDHIIQEFCNLVSHPHTTVDDIEHFLAHNAIDINRKNPVTGMRPVAHAVSNINSFIYLVEKLHASLQVDDDFLKTNIMRRAETCAAIKNYFVENALWKKMGNETTKFHAYAWAGLSEMLFSELDIYPHKISAVTTDNKSIFYWADTREIRAALEERAQNYFAQLLELKKWKKLRNFKFRQAVDEFYSANFFDFPDGELSSKNVNIFFKGGAFLLESLRFHFTWVISLRPKLDDKIGQKFLKLFDTHTQVLGKIVNNQLDISQVLTTYYEYACSAYNLIQGQENIEVRRVTLSVKDLASGYYNLACTLVNCAEVAISNEDSDFSESAETASNIYNAAQLSLDICRTIATSRPEEITEADFIERIEAYAVVLKESISWIDGISPKATPLIIHSPLDTQAIIPDSDEKPQAANHPHRLFTSSSSSASSSSSSSSSRPPVPNSNDNTPRYI